MGVKLYKTIILIILVVIIIVAVQCLKTFILDPSNECPFSNTVNITDGHQYTNDSYEFDNVIYDKRFYKSYNFIINENRKKETVETHIRGCLCAIKQCIRMCEDYENIDHIKVYNEHIVEQTISLQNNTDYHIMIQRPCETMISVNKNNDKWKFYKASTLILRIQIIFLLS